MLVQLIKQPLPMHERFKFFWAVKRCPFKKKNMGQDEQRYCIKSMQKPKMDNIMDPRALHAHVPKLKGKGVSNICSCHCPCPCSLRNLTTNTQQTKQTI